MLRHRLVLTYEALAEGVDADAILDRVLEAVADAAARPRPGGGRVSTVQHSAPRGRPAGPVPGRCPAALLRKLDLTVRRRIDGLLAGDHRSSALGDGTELAQVRPYVPGDDVRLIDWNVTARTGEPHVRVNVAERALDDVAAARHVRLDDASAPPTGASADVAEGVALAVGHLAVAPRQPARARHLRRPRTPSRRPPGRADRGLLGAARRRSRREPDLRADRRRPRSAPRSRGSARLARRARASSSSSPTSAARATGGRGCSQLAGRHDVIAVEIRDPREQELPDVGDLWLVDPETGRQLRVDTRSRKLRERFGDAAAAERERARPRAALARRARTSSCPPPATGCAGSSRFLQTEGRRR